MPAPSSLPSFPMAKADSITLLQPCLLLLPFFVLFVFLKKHVVHSRFYPFLPSPFSTFPFPSSFFLFFNWAKCGIRNRNYQGSVGLSPSLAMKTIFTEGLCVDFTAKASWEPQPGRRELSDSGVIFWFLSTQRFAFQTKFPALCEGSCS